MRAPFTVLPVLTICMVLPTSVGAQTDFPLPAFDTGSSGPTAFASGDLNADGRPDVAVVHDASDKLAILFGKPGGSFESPWLFATGDNPKSVAIDDFDLDGRPDVAAFNMSSATLTIVLLQATGPVTWTVPTGGNGETFAVGDLDGDGDPDVVTGNLVQQTLSVVPGLGPAGFGAPVTYPAGAWPRALALRDFDGDGALDVASVNSNPATLTLRHGNGQGGLLAATTLATAPFMSGLAAADLDGDRDPDLATASGTDLLLLWNGSGGFASPQAVPLGLNASVALAGDLDGNGLIDLLLKAAPPGDDDRLQLAAGTGGGAFAPLVELLPLAPTQVLLDDADDDGRTDVLGLLASMGLCVFRGDGEGALVQPPPVALAPEAGVFAVGDVNADGIDDLVSSSVDNFFPFGAGPDTAWVQLGDGEGGWGAPQMQPFGAAVFLDLVDVTQDGHVDAVTIGAGLSQVRIVPGDGAGNFGPASTLIPLGSELISRGATADLDADGDVDIVLLTWVEWFMGSQFRDLVTLRNDGAGQWTTIVSNYDSATQFQPQSHIALGRCDGDAYADAVILDAPHGHLLFCQGSAGTGFGTAQVLMTVSGGDGDRPLALLDLDADGALDIVLGSSSAVVVSYGHGDGTFDPKQTIGSGRADDPQLADLDGDGTNELVTDQSDVISWAHGVTVWRADGEGGFARQVYYSGPTTRSFITDPDLDGRPDLLTVQAADDFLGPVQGVGQVLRNHVLLAAWTDFGHGLAGSDGIPALAGGGTLAAGSPGSLSLTHANPNHLAVLFISPVAQPTPFKGGMLVPVPPALSVALGTGPTGSITIPWNAWPSLPSGSDWFFQYGIVDSAGPAGASLSNALRALQP